MNFDFKYHINDENNMCLCKKCRMDRAIEKSKETPESIKQKRLERAMDVARRKINENNRQHNQF